MGWYQEVPVLADLLVVHADLLGEHRSRPPDASELTVLPAAGVARGRQLADVALDKRQALGARGRVDRVSVLTGVGGGHRRRQVRRRERPAAEDRKIVRLLDRGRRAGRVEDPRDPRERRHERDDGDVAGSSSSSTFACASSAVGSGLVVELFAPAPSMNTSPERSFAPGFPLKSQVAYAVVIDPPSEWPPTTTLPPSLLGVLHDPPDVLDLDVHAPVAGERDVGVGDELEVLRDARVGQEPR